MNLGSRKIITGRLFLQGDENTRGTPETGGGIWRDQNIPLVGLNSQKQWELEIGGGDWNFRDKE